MNHRLYVILTGLPTLFYAISGVWWAVEQLIDSEGGFSAQYPMIFTAGFATGAAMLIFYCIHLATNRRIDRTARFLWLFRFVIASPISLLVYWAAFIARIRKKGGKGKDEK